MPKLRESEYFTTYILVDEDKGRVLKTLTIDTRRQSKTAQYVKELWSEYPGKIYLKIGGQQEGK